MLSFFLKLFISQLFPSETILKIPFVIQTQYQVNTGFRLVFLSLGNAAVLWPRNLFLSAGWNHDSLNICLGVLLLVSSCSQLKCCGWIIQRLGRNVWKKKIAKEILQKIFVLPREGPGSVPSKQVMEQIAGDFGEQKVLAGAPRGKSQLKAFPSSFWCLFWAT